MNRLLVIPAAVVLIGVIAVVAILTTRGGGSGGVDVALAGAGPRVWIDHPLSGSQFRLGQTVTIRWHASATDGVRQVAVHVNGEPLALAEDFDHAAQIVTQRHQWTPSAPGEYVIEVTASGADGLAGPSARKRVTVAGEPTPAAPAPSASPAPGATSTPPPAASPTQRPGDTATPRSTDTPAATPQPTQAPASSTPPPPTVTPVPPTSTPTPVPDTTPPPVPYTIWPKDNILIEPCFAPNLILRWSLPVDPSGVQDFRIEMQRKTVSPPWTAVALPNPVVTEPALDVYAQVHCGDAYRWRVRARDGAGNTGAYSAWAEFGITLP